ncbi:MAG: phage tail protein, partial [Pseudomonadota bacterium]
MAKELDNIVEIRFDNQRFDFWKKVSIRDSVDDLCASINLSLTAPGAGKSLGYTANTIAEVFINNVLVSTVRADAVKRSVTDNSHSISFSARSLGRELVDCQYSKTLSGIKLGEIVKQLCNTFKVPVKIVGDTAIVPH